MLWRSTTCRRANLPALWVSTTTVTSIPLPRSWRKSARSLFACYVRLLVRCLCHDYLTFLHVRRYIWAYRVALARSFHDMKQQKYANKKFMTPAWKPLHNYVFGVSPAVTVSCTLAMSHTQQHTNYIHIIHRRSARLNCWLPSSGVIRTCIKSSRSVCGIQPGLGTHPGVLVLLARLIYIVEYRYTKRYRSLTI